jgi:biofilm PGA synthesis lipoprotein PgaB
LPPESVVLTFDDGYESFYTRVYPELQAYKVPATVFVIVRPTAHSETASPALPHLKWEQLAEMLASGLVTVGPHTYDQHLFVQLPDGKKAPALVARILLTVPNRGETVEEYETRVLGDFAEANRLLEEHLGVRSEYFAFPYGRYDSGLIRLSRLSGYRFLFTTRPVLVTRTTDPLSIPRFGTGGQVWTGPRFEEFLRTVFKTGRMPVFPKEPAPPFGPPGPGAPAVAPAPAQSN